MKGVFRNEEGNTNRRNDLQSLQKSCGKGFEFIGWCFCKSKFEEENAVVDLKSDVDDDILAKAVSDAGYEVVSISEKKGLFG